MKSALSARSAGQRFRSGACGNAVTVNLKRLAANQAAGLTRSVSGALANIKGAYSEWLVETLRRDEGWTLLGDVHHINAAGYDRIMQRGGIVRLIEAKAREALRLEDISSLIGLNRATGEIRFDSQYFQRFGRAAQDAFNAGRLEIEVLLNGPASTAIKQSLLAELGLREGDQIIGVYEDSFGNPRTLEVIITAINQ